MALVHITIRNTVQCTVMWEKKINFSRTIKKVLQSQEEKEHPSYNKTKNS